MRDAVALLRALLAAGRAVPAALPSGVPSEPAARSRLREGIPALAGEPLLSGDSLCRSVRAFAGALAGHPGAGEARAAAETVAAGLERMTDPDARDALAAAALAGDWSAAAELSATLDVDALVLATVLDHATRPVLRAGAARVAALLHEARWSRGDCPACGAPPLIAELRPESSGETDRVLRCGRCATAWPFPRQRCAACGERDHARLSWLHAEGEESFRRAQHCARCHGYLKEIAVLDPLDGDAVLVQDLATAALDFGAAERGLHRVSGYAPPSARESQLQ